MKYPEHTSTQFDVELNALCSNVLRMGEMVESQLYKALESLATGDLMTIDLVINEGAVVNAMEIEIDESCTNILVRRQPTANDLRLVKTIVKTINDLERVGDEAESIAHLAKLMVGKNSRLFPRHRQIIYTANIALDMLRAALEAFENLDTDAARKVGHKDALIDEEFRSILRHLAAYMLEDTREH